MKIRDLEKNSQLSDMPLLVNKVVTGTTNQGSPYLSVTFADDSGLLNGKVWSSTTEDTRVCKLGSVVLVSGMVNLYQNSLQLKVTGLKEVEQSKFDMNDFVIAAPMSAQDLQMAIEKVIMSIKNNNIQLIINGMLDRYKESFYKFPAASKNHHEFYSGLAMHVKGMLDLASAVCDLYPSLNRDLLFGGIILHDLGKCVELSGPVATEYTTEGRLLGHISIIQAEVYEIAKELNIVDSEEVLLLRHMILSHHGKYEFGSPVLPLIIEAEMLTFIDNMDARMNMFDKVLATVGDGEFTARVFSLEGRSVYKHNLK